MFKKIAIIAAIISLVACGEKVPEKTPEQVQSERNAAILSLDAAKIQARENATANAKAFRRDNAVLFGEWGLTSEGDSTQSLQCPVGDGWATLKMVEPEGKKTVKLKCATTSLANGCVLDSEFKSKPFNGEDGSCGSNRLPYPIPKLVN